MSEENTNDSLSAGAPGRNGGNSLALPGPLDLPGVATDVSQMITPSEKCLVPAQVPIMHSSSARAATGMTNLSSSETAGGFASGMLQDFVQASYSDILRLEKLVLPPKQSPNTSFPVGDGVQTEPAVDRQPTESPSSSSLHSPDSPFPASPVRHKARGWESTVKLVSSSAEKEGDASGGKAETTSPSTNSPSTAVVQQKSSQFHAVPSNSSVGSPPLQLNPSVAAVPAWHGVGGHTLGPALQRMDKDHLVQHCLALHNTLIDSCNFNVGYGSPSDAPASYKLQLSHGSVNNVISISVPQVVPHTASLRQGQRMSVVNIDKRVSVASAGGFSGINLYQQGSDENASQHSISSFTGRGAVVQTATLEKTIDSEGMKNINEYVILDELGHGACGKVKLAFDSQRCRMVAIKLVRRVSDTALAKSVITQNSAAANFRALQSEIAMMKKLRHKNIVALYEVIDDAGANKLYLVMQYVDKGPITKVGEDLTCAPVPIEQLNTYARHVCAGLAYLHNHNVVHRDIKPENILVSTDEEAFLADFGVSEMFEDKSGKQISGRKGTKLFMAPELLETGTADGKPLDVWALGVTFYTLLAGKMPFSTEDKITDVMFRVDYINLPCDWVELLKGMLRRNPKERLKVMSVRSRVKKLRTDAGPYSPSDIKEDANRAFEAAAALSDSKRSEKTDESPVFKSPMMMNPDALRTFDGSGSTCIGPPSDTHTNKLGMSTDFDLQGDITDQELNMAFTPMSTRALTNARATSPTSATAVTHVSASNMVGNKPPELTLPPLPQDDRDNARHTGEGGTQHVTVVDSAAVLSQQHSSPTLVAQSIAFSSSTRWGPPGNHTPDNRAGTQSAASPFHEGDTNSARRESMRYKKKLAVLMEQDSGSTFSGASVSFDEERKRRLTVAPEVMESMEEVDDPAK